MIKFSFEDQQISLPTKWSEVTVAMFCAEGYRSGNSVKLLAALSGIEEKQLFNTTKDLTKYFKKASDFIVKNPDGWKGEPTVPTTFTLLDVECKVPKNIELERFGQKVMFGTAVHKHKYTDEAIPEAIALYLAPQIYPDDWYERIDEVAEAVGELKIIDCYSLASFFLLNIKALKSAGLG